MRFVSSHLRLGLSVALALALWEFLARSIQFVLILISRPTRMAEFVRDNWASLLQDLGHTAFIAAAGLVAAILVGGLLGIVGATHKPTGKIFELTSTIMQSIPLVVFAPFTIILFGVGYVSQVLLATLMAIFPIIVGVIVAERRAAAQFAELIHLYRVDGVDRARDIYLPYMMPSLLAHVRISAGLAILGAVIAEFTGSATGLGRNIFLGTVRLDPELMMTSLLLTCFMGLGVHAALGALERKASWWDL